MRIGVPREIRDGTRGVGMTPAGVRMPERLDADPRLAAGVLLWDGTRVHASLASAGGTAPALRPWHNATALHYAG